MSHGSNRAGIAATIFGHGAPGRESALDDPRWERARAEMVERQIVRRGIEDARVLSALRRVPRHVFVPEAWRAAAYADRPLEIGHGQTISQPYIVALMSAALGLQGFETVLEIGTGSGYQTAVLTQLAARVHSLEINPELAAAAREVLRTHGYDADVHAADGNYGWPAAAPYDAILVTAAPQAVPESLVEQLRPGGRLVVPVGPAEDQQLVRLVRTPTGTERTRMAPVRFVPMTGGTRHPEDPS